MIQTRTVRVHCPRCGKSVTLSLDDAVARLHRSGGATAHLTCPECALEYEIPTKGLEHWQEARKS